MDDRKDQTNPSVHGKDNRNILKLIEECISDPVLKADLQSEENTKELLDYMLSSNVIPDTRVSEGLTTILTHVYREISAQAGCTVKECILNPRTGVSVLKEIKQNYKNTADTTRSKAENQAATVIYFMAITSALVFHQEKISSLPADKLENAFDMLLCKSWLYPELADLLGKAKEALKHQHG